MPGKVGVKIKAGRNLPVMDRSSDTTDAYVEIKLGSVTHKTDVCRKSLHPQWNTDWFRFELDDAELQDEPLQIRLMDHDTYSANDAIGKVNISLNPLCLENAGQSSQGKGAVMSGWIPVFDTMHGIRGEVNIIVKVDLFSDANKFRQSSCGVQFFHSPCVPHGYRAQIIHGFVEELVVNDDPEYQWIDKIRTPRASNEARQVVFLKLSGQVQRKIGLKAINLGANAVIGYTQCFDLEGDVGVVGRGIGTAVTLVKIQETTNPPVMDTTLIEDRSKFDYDSLGDSDTSAGLVYKILGIDDPNTKVAAKSPSVVVKRQWKPATKGAAAQAIPEVSETGSEGERKLERMQKTSHRLRHHVKRITRSLKPKAADSDESSRSPASSISDISFSESARNSLSDLGNLIRFRKRNRGRFSRSASQGSGMASVLVSSILHGPSLDSISEGHDSARSTPIKMTRSEKAESMSNLSTSPKKLATPKTHLSPLSLEATSMVNLQAQQFAPKKLLKSPNLSISSISSISTTEDCFSDDEEEEECSETTTPNEVVLVDADTVSMVVKSVLAQESMDKGEENWIQPGSTQDETETSSDRKQSAMLRKTQSVPMHLSIGAAGRTASLRRQRELTHSIADFGMAEKPPSIDEIDESVDEWIQPGSTVDEPEYEDKERRGSLLHELRENLSETFHNWQEHMHLPHFADDKSKMHKHGMVESAMQTMLVDKAHILGAEEPSASPPASPPPVPEKRRGSLESIAKMLHLPFGHHKTKKSEHELKSDTGMIANAMKTILMEPFALSDEITDYENVNKFYDYKMHPLDEAAMGATPEPDRSSSELVSSSGGSGGGGAGLGTSPAKAIAVVAGSGSNNGHARTESMSVKIGQSPSKGGHMSSNNSLGAKDTSAIYRRSSDSDLSITPKGNSLCVASERLVAATAMMRINAPSQLKSTNPDNLDMLEYPFLTMAKYPKGFIMHMGATVAARSVKLLERVPNPDEPETRDSWWTELRMEIRSHARALGCNVILGYSEVTTISDDVCVLSATGTAAVINMSYNGSSQADISISSKRDVMVSSLDDKDAMKVDPPAPMVKEISSSVTAPSKITPINNPLLTRDCSLCHIPYSATSVPFNVKMKKCAICKKGRVPDVLLATIEIPESMSITGRGCFMQAQVVRVKRDLRSESNAKEISDGLPFLEYELHRLLINKLKAKGMNAIFGLKAHVAIGERMMALIATGTAVFLTALPPPTVPKIVAGNSWTDKGRLNDLQKSLQETYERNREIYQLKCLDPDLQNGKQSDTDDSDEENLEIDLNAGSKDTCVLEVDDIEDLEILSLLMETCPPEGFHVVNTQTVPGLQDLEVVRNLQMFTQVWRAKLSVGQTVGGFPKHFQRLLQTVYFKLRSMIPCAICDLRFRLDLPESDEIQVLVTGMALGLGDPLKLSKMRRKTSTSTTDSNAPSTVTNGNSKKDKQEDDLMFSLDEDQSMETVLNPTYLQAANYGTHSLKLRKSSPSRTKFSSMRMARHLPLHDRYGVDITPLSYVPGGKIEKYLGNLNFFFIRETTSIREVGGISGFVHSFITELLAVVRAHIAALGGNAMVSFYMTELILVDNQHKNQGQCLISIGGDVVSVSYYSDD